MACKLDKDCVFSDQTPECDRVQVCCNEKLAVKDGRINGLLETLILTMDMLLELRTDE